MIRQLLIAGVLLVGLCVHPGRARADAWWARDKALHFGVSAALAGGGYGATALVTERTSVRLGAGAGVALAAGIGKELSDRAFGGDPSLKDLTWDVAGTATGLLVAWAIDRWLLR